MLNADNYNTNKNNMNTLSSNNLDLLIQEIKIFYQLKNYTTNIDN